MNGAYNPAPRARHSQGRVPVKSRASSSSARRMPSITLSATESRMAGCSPPGGGSLLPWYGERSGAGGAENMYCWRSSTCDTSMSSKFTTAASGDTQPAPGAYGGAQRLWGARTTSYCDVQRGKTTTGAPRSRGQPQDNRAYPCHSSHGRWQWTDFIESLPYNCAMDGLPRATPISN